MDQQEQRDLQRGQVEALRRHGVGQTQIVSILEITRGRAEYYSQLAIHNNPALRLRNRRTRSQLQALDERIRPLLAQGMKQAMIAEMCGVDVFCVGNAVKRLKRQQSIS